MGINTFDSVAIELILRSAQGNLRRCRNLCYGSLIEAARETEIIATIRHVLEDIEALLPWNYEASAADPMPPKPPD